ncbi:hypothetical protein ACKWTF_000997 [Chironomus riparius]
MNNGDLYLRNNDVQRRDSKEVIDEFSHYFKWKYDGMDKLLDIGCGTGDVLYDFVLPEVPKNIQKIIGIDISQKILECARENFGSESMEFHQADISSISCCQNFGNEEFDNITSFYCLHWIQNQKQTFANIHKLLRPNGVAIINFLIETPLFDIYERLSKFKKYREYMKDVKQFISPYHHEEQPLEMVRKYCKNAGFIINHMEIREKIYFYRDEQQLKEALKSVNPFTKRMPQKLQQNFIDDYVKLVGEITENRFHNDEKIISRYRLLIAVLSK